MTFTDDGHHSYLVVNTPADQGPHQAHVGDEDALQAVQHGWELV